MMKSRFYLAFICIVFTLASCSTLKDTVYFQTKSTTPPIVNNQTTQISSHILSAGDVISLNINTPLQTSAQLLNLKEGGGFLIKADGTIEIPVIGIVTLAGLTTTSAKDTLLLRAKVYFNEPYVNLQLVSFKVTVLGEVLSPGIKALVSENATLLDALASSGDLTSFGNRSNIKVLRGDSIFYLNLTEMTLFKSNGFFLQSNDIIYVQPLRKKNTLSNLSTSMVVTSFASVLITLTTTLILLTK